jgi:hypothetical protein
MSLRGTLVVVLVMAIVTLAAAGHHTWEDRISSSMRNRVCRGGRGDGSWVERTAAERCTTCHSRCYTTTFSAEAQTNGTPALLCDNSGEECDITLVIMTAPCCLCHQGHSESDIFQENNMEEFQQHETESFCEVPFFGVLVNGYWTLPLDSAACNLTQNPLFTQEWVEDDYTVNSIKDCAASLTSGATLVQVYDKAYPNGRFPDPCFGDSHWRSSHLTENDGLQESTFQLRRPESSAIWFQKTLTTKEAPREIACSRLPKKADIPVYSPPA